MSLCAKAYEHVEPATMAAKLKLRSLYTRRVSEHRPDRNAPTVFGKSARRHAYRVTIAQAFADVATHEMFN
uniref:Uncharacterized protein n=1 Tax=Trichogramma kaykai TaxID=54128 RepID=A0ABD2VZV8_9HYME